jgi:GT2 family glycosyltransferase
MNPHVEGIPLVPEGEARPCWSVMIPTYNCAAYLTETLSSVLAQDPGAEHMQIEVVDDCSTGDDPEAIVRALGSGRVGFHRQPENVGHVENFNTCLRRSRGRLVHLLHGDDLVLPGFYETMERAYATAPQIGAAFCRDERIDEFGRHVSTPIPLSSTSGVLENWLEIIAGGNRLQAPAMTVRREVYERLGGFDRRITCYGEDWEMWVRIASHYPVWFQAELLAAYRIHRKSLTARGTRTGAHAHDYRKAIEINRGHLPADRVDEWSEEAAVNFARACMRRGWRALGAREVRGAVSHFREGVRTSRSPTVLGEFAVHGARFAASAVSFPLRALQRRRAS